jgi:hypothetical protein
MVTPSASVRAPAERMGTPVPVRLRWRETVALGFVLATFYGLGAAAMHARTDPHPKTDRPPAVVKVIERR